MSETPKKKPTIDERLEALAQSVELMAGIMNALATEGAKTDKRLDRLVRIVLRHEKRLEALES